jgi:hypothetical protein
VQSSPRTAPALSAALVLGVVAGATVSVLAFYLARYGPSGEGWSFRGNGALAAFTVVPAILAAGWSAVIAYYRGRSGWLAFGLAAGLIGLALALADASLLPLFGAAFDQTLGAILLVVLLLWAFVAPVIAAATSGPVRPHPVPITVALGSAGLWLAGTLAGLIVIGVVLPAGS